MYRLTKTGIVNVETGAIIPADPSNRDWQAYQSWCAVGNKAETVQPSLEQLRATLLARINTACERELVILKLGFPASEVDSWAKQEREARALQTNPEAVTPLLSTIATARGIDVSVLAARVLAKSDAYAVAAGKLIGQRQALEDALMAIDLQAPDAPEQLAAITWPAA